MKDQKLPTTRLKPVGLEMAGNRNGNGWIWMVMVGNGYGNDRDLQGMSGNW